MAKTKRPERELSLEEVRQAVAVGLRDRVNAVAEKFKDLKTREIGHKLGKHELCPLCGNADIPGSCTCIGLSKSELSKKSPPGKFKDLPEKLKDKGYSADSAFAIAWSAKDKADAKKTELDKAMIGTQPSTPQVPPASTTAATVKSPAVKKNALMGYDSNGESNGGQPSGGPGMAMAEKEMEKGVGGDMDKGEMCKNCGMSHAPGKDYDHSLSKEEITENKVVKCATCGSTHKIGVSYDHELVKEKDSNIPVDDPMGPEATLPDDKKVEEPDETGSGGETKKLAKAGALEGMMGGSFKPKGSMGKAPLPGLTPPAPHPDTTASLKAVSALAPKAQSPIIRANQQMSNFKSIAHNPLAMPGNTPLANPKAMTGHAVSGIIAPKPVAAPAPAVAKPDALSQVRTQLNTDAKRPNDALQAVRDKMNLDADKKAGGVGWLNSLISRFKKPVAAPIGTGPVRSQMGPMQGIRGAAALARSEKENIDLVKSLGDCALCHKPEHLGNC